MNKVKIFSILLLVLAGCGFNPYDIPFVGWRLEVAAQQGNYQKSLEEQAIKKDVEITNDNEGKDDG